MPDHTIILGTSCLTEAAVVLKKKKKKAISGSLIQPPYHIPVSEAEAKVEAEEPGEAE